MSNRSMLSSKASADCAGSWVLLALATGAGPRARRRVQKPSRVLLLLSCWASPGPPRGDALVIIVLVCIMG